ncbi:MAG: nucleotidyltransferase domain-containing protein [Burkholderiaceae bacterium]
MSLGEWDLLVRQARAANVLASLHAVLEEAGILHAVPGKALEHLQWAWCAAERHRQAVVRELHLIRYAVKDTGIPLILLKGAAYLQAGLPAARGRIFADIDVLVAKNRIGAVEAALMLNGWASFHLDKYDQRYYRAWMHEIPPMRHIRRMTTIDVHHAIVPETAPVHPDPEKLRAAAVPAGKTGQFQVLAPVDMVLHSAVHLFHDGEFDQGFRDLIDLKRLLEDFSRASGFWPALLQRADELELARPLFYALRYADRMLGVSIPADVVSKVRPAGPSNQMLALMDRLFHRALLPAHPSCADGLTKTARYVLYLRGNALRMPAPLLARHLFHKAFLSPRTT